MSDLEEKINTIEKYFNSNALDDTFALSIINHEGKIKIRIIDKFTNTSVVYSENDLTQNDMSLGGMLLEFMKYYPNKYRSNVDIVNGNLDDHRKTLTDDFISKSDWKIVKKIKNNEYLRGMNKNIIYFNLGWIGCSLFALLLQLIISIL